MNCLYINSNGLLFKKYDNIVEEDLKNKDTNGIAINLVDMLKLNNGNWIAISNNGVMYSRNRLNECWMRVFNFKLQENEKIVSITQMYNKANIAKNFSNNIILGLSSLNKLYYKNNIDDVWKLININLPMNTTSISSMISDKNILYTVSSGSLNKIEGVLEESIKTSSVSVNTSQTLKIVKINFDKKIYLIDTIGKVYSLNGTTLKDENLSGVRSIYVFINNSFKISVFGYNLGIYNNMLKFSGSNEGNYEINIKEYTDNNYQLTIGNNYLIKNNNDITTSFTQWKLWKINIITNIFNLYADNNLCYINYINSKIIMNPSDKFVNSNFNISPFNDIIDSSLSECKKGIDMMIINEIRYQNLLEYYNLVKDNLFANKTTAENNLNNFRREILDNPNSDFQKAYKIPENSPYVIDVKSCDSNGKNCSKIACGLRNGMAAGGCCGAYDKYVQDCCLCGASTNNSRGKFTFFNNYVNLDSNTTDNNTFLENGRFNTKLFCTPCSDQCGEGSLGDGSCVNKNYKLKDNLNPLYESTMNTKTQLENEVNRTTQEYLNHINSPKPVNNNSYTFCCPSTVISDINSQGNNYIDVKQIISCSSTSQGTGTNSEGTGVQSVIVPTFSTDNQTDKGTIIKNKIASCIFTSSTCNNTSVNSQVVDISNIKNECGDTNISVSQTMNSSSILICKPTMNNINVIKENLTKKFSTDDANKIMLVLNDTTLEQINQCSSKKNIDQSFIVSRVKLMCEEYKNGILKNKPSINITSLQNIVSSEYSDCVGKIIGFDQIVNNLSENASKNDSSSKNNLTIGLGVGIGISCLFFIIFIVLGFKYHLVWFLALLSLISLGICSYYLDYNLK